MPKVKQKFKPGYYCPECECLVETPRGARPRIWHPECKPATKTIARRKRICPGCGEHWELDNQPHLGSPSSFHPEHDDCKEKYRNSLFRPVPKVATKEILPENQHFYCWRCGKKQVEVSFRKQYKEKLCKTCFLTDPAPVTSENQACVICNKPRRKIGTSQERRMRICLVCSCKYDWLKGNYEHEEILSLILDPTDVPEKLLAYMKILDEKGPPEERKSTVVFEEEDEESKAIWRT